MTRLRCKAAGMILLAACLLTVGSGWSMVAKADEKDAAVKDQPASIWMKKNLSSRKISWRALSAPISIRSSKARKPCKV